MVHLHPIRGVVQLAKWGWTGVTHPHTAWFAVRHVLHPGEVIAATQAFDAAKQMERRLFGPGDHADDGIDALRHTFAAAMLTYHLVHDHGESARNAINFTQDAGRAYERDGADKGETRASARMDEYNNAVGAKLGADLASDHGRSADGALLTAVRAALAGGALQVIEHATGALRSSRWSDLPLTR